MRWLALVLVLLAACHPRLSMGTDMSARVTGPLAQLQPLPRLAAPAPALATTPPPEGRNYSAGIAFGDRRISVGLRVHANNISGSTLDPMAGPRYMSGAAALDLRWTMIGYRGVALVGLLAPSYTGLVDTLSGRTTYGEGIRYGGGLQWSVGALSVFGDAYQEDLMFLDGPAKGTSRRTGITIGVAFQP